MYKRKIVWTGLASAYAVLLSTASFADAPRLTDEQIRTQIIALSLRSYRGNCPCPYNVDRAGRRCGARSAWNRPGGYTPVCFPTEISDEQVKEYREKFGV
jgi:hypothetical protein